MAQPEIMELRPTGWENDPAEERFRLSTLDWIPVCCYNHYLIFWRLQDDTKEKAIEVLKGGIEKTLSQARHLVGNIEPDSDGGYSFVKRKESAVKLVVMRYDGEGDKWPSIDDIESKHFAQHALGDNLGRWGLPEMLWGERPESELENKPVTSAFQINLIRGGLVLSLQSHHYMSDVMGFSNFTRQLADNCAAVARGTPFPPWDPANIDSSRFERSVPEADMVEGPPIRYRHPDHVEQEVVLFHLPQSKAAEIKRRATPTEPGARWISTYDAMNAFIWRALSRVRAPLHKPDLAKPLHWGQAVNMRTRLHNPPMPARMMRAVVAGAFSDTQPVAAPSAGEVIAPEAEVPLSRLALYIRAITDSCDEAHFEGVMNAIAHCRNKRGISVRIDSAPPLGIFLTDHRPGDTAGLILIYAPVRSANPDEGCMFTVTMEKELVPVLRADPEWSSFFEYRGLDC
ncbi:Acyl transferase [Apiospora kogelbergensis]|uniref:Acyl transferase n=1 Tax=Apiospora kogelbergensis TaxID=1337665 RepID=UPI00312F15FE